MKLIQIPFSHNCVKVRVTLERKGIPHEVENIAPTDRSPVFAATLYFSLIVMYDAAGLRRAAGRQAMILNRLIDEHFKHPEVGAQLP